MPPMHIVAIGWLYVTVLMALSENGIVAGLLTFVFYGLMPTMLLLWIFGHSTRRRRKPRHHGQMIRDPGQANQETVDNE